MDMATELQDRLVEGSIESIDQGRDVFLSGPTGCGKSRQFSLIGADQAHKGNRVIVLAHLQSLVLQARVNMERWATDPVETSIGMDGRIDQSAPVVYTTVQTAHELRDQLEPYNVAIIDEGHHAKTGNDEYGETMAALIARNPDIRFVAASATPPPLYAGLHQRLAGADKHIMTFEEAVAARLVDLPETIMPPLHLKDNQNVHAIVDRRRTSGAGSDIEGGLTKDIAAARGDDWSEQLVTIYERHLQDRRTLAFFDTIREAEGFMTAAQAEGHSPAIVHSRRGLAANEATMEDFRRGRNRLLVSIDMITEGVDLDADGILLDKKTTSATEYKQAIGRESRSHGRERGRKALLVDTGASTLLHGDIGAIANMQTLRGGLERRTVSELDLLPDRTNGRYSPWIEVRTPTDRQVWGTRLDGAVVYAARAGERYATLCSSTDRKGARVDLLQIDGQRKGMPSGEALGGWLSDAIRRNEKPLSRLASAAGRGANSLIDVVRRDWEKNAASIERTISMLASGPIAAQSRQAAYAR